MAVPFNIGVDWGGVARALQIRDLYRANPQLGGGGQLAGLQQLQPILGDMVRIPNGNGGVVQPQAIPWPPQRDGAQWNPPAAIPQNPVAPWNPQPAGQMPWGLDPAAEEPEFDNLLHHYDAVVYSPTEQPVSCCFDTGSPQCFSSEQSLRRLWGMFERRRLPRPYVIEGVGGIDQQAYEYTNIIVKLKAEADYGFLETKAKVIIMPEQRPNFPEILLGLNYFKDNKLTMHWGEGKTDDWLEWGGLKIPRVTPQHPR